jgi:hypothetical protein
MTRRKTPSSEHLNGPREPRSALDRERLWRFALDSLKASVESQSAGKASVKPGNERRKWDSSQRSKEPAG